MTGFHARQIGQEMPATTTNGSLLLQQNIKFGNCNLDHSFLLLLSLSSSLLLSLSLLLPLLLLRDPLQFSDIFWVIIEAFRSLETQDVPQDMSSTKDS